MRLFSYKIVRVWVLLLLPAAFAYGQDARNNIRLGAIVDDYGDTVAMVMLPEYVHTARLPKKFARAHRKWTRLRHNVYKVYPYAVIAGGVLQDVDVNLEQIGDDREARKKYLKSVEKELTGRFRGELEDLTITQGQILVKLINRQTGKDCFSIIQELKGGFSAVVWQSVALLFSNNLRREYDPAGNDREIELIVRELEEDLRFRQRYYDHASR